MATSMSRKRHRASDTSTNAAMLDLKQMDAPIQSQNQLYTPPQPHKLIKKPHIDVIDLDSESDDYIFNNSSFNDDHNDSAVEFVDSMDLDDNINNNINNNNNHELDHFIIEDNDDDGNETEEIDQISYSPDAYNLQQTSKLQPRSRSRHLSLLLKSVRRKFNTHNNKSQTSSNDSLPLTAGKKQRTRSLPQLSYSTMIYNPYLNRESISMKIGEVKASKIHQNLNNHNNQYTYYNNGNINRKMSFQHDIPYMQRSSPLLVEEKICDDADGHYSVKINSGFANDRFIIKEMLGQGTFGKVVKALDNQTNEMVAIKIIKSIPKYREASKIELRVLTMLKKHDPLNEFQCIHLRECFDYRNHICIVTDLLKMSLYDFMESTNFSPFPGSHIQAFTRQMLRSVAFLHDLNLIHTDLKPENILLINDDSIDRNGKMILKDPRIFIIDFGSAIFNDEYHSSVVSTRHYRAPEIILGVGWSFPCDMWSLGCILVELLTGEALFKTHENEQHLAMMEKVIGSRVDLNMVNKCLDLYSSSNSNNIKTNSRFDTSVVDAFDSSTKFLKFSINSKSVPNRMKKDVKSLKLLDDLIWDKVGNDKRGEKFWKYFIDLVKRMLTWNPNNRITAREALNHKWFTKGVNDEGIN